MLTTAGRVVRWKEILEDKKRRRNKEVNDAQMLQRNRGEDERKKIKPDKTIVWIRKRISTTN